MLFQAIKLVAFSFNWGGDKEFVMKTKAKLGAMAIGRRELENTGGYELKEPQPVGSKLEVKTKVLTTAFLTLKSAAQD